MSMCSRQEAEKQKLIYNVCNMLNTNEHNALTNKERSVRQQQRQSEVEDEEYGDDTNSATTTHQKRRPSSMNLLSCPQNICVMYAE